MANLIGKMGEDAAVNFLQKKGMQIIERNYSSRCGEIDIIAKEGQYVIFIEVKTRKFNSMVSPIESVDERKQKRILKTAMLYLQEKGKLYQTRFDIVEVIYKKDGCRNVIISINHLKNAFAGEEDSFEIF